MKKIEVLTWGVNHIAENYGLGADTENFQEDEQVCLYVTDKHPNLSPAPINDVQLLCDDLGIDKNQIEVSEYGIDVYLNYAWFHTKEECEGYCDTEEAGKLLEEYTPTGNEMWKRANVAIGTDIEQYKHERARQMISAYCSKHFATEENPIRCEEKTNVMLTIGHEEAMGVSELQLPQVTEIFHDPEGIVWVKISGSKEPIEADTLSAQDLKDILQWCEEYL